MQLNGFLSVSSRSSNSPPGTVGTYRGSDWFGNVGVSKGESTTPIFGVLHHVAVSLHPKQVIQQNCRVAPS